jgi:hypothetical protein
MSHKMHSEHTHVHGESCGHPGIKHGAHVDYLHDGHLHHAHDGHVDECILEAGAANPVACTPSHACAAHDSAHQHMTGCGHPMVPHGDHADYLVSGHLHHAHGGHCDDHGAVSAA